MPPKKNTKTLFTKTNNVDITTLLDNIDNNLQTGGTKKIVKTTNNKTKSKSKSKTKNNDTDTDNYSENSDTDLDSQTGKGSGEEKSDVEDIETENNDIDDLNDKIEDDDVDEDGDKDEKEENEDEENEENENSDNEKSEESDDDKDTNKCYSKYAKDKDDFDLDEYFKDDDIVIMKNGRVGKPILFKYEKVRLLSDRSRQLAEGAKPMIKDTTGLSHKEIALLELKHKLIPLIIERPIPNSGSERWRLSELEIPDYD